MIDLEKFVADYESCMEKADEFNGFDNTAEGKEKKKKFNQIWREWSEEKIKELSLQEYLGEQAINDCREIMDDDYPDFIAVALLKDTNAGYQLMNKQESLALISLYKRNMNFVNNESFYVGLHFKTTIKECFYAGSFLKHKEGMSLEQGVELVEDMLEDSEGFMPTLVKKIESFMGENNFISDGWAFGSDDFGLYWNVRKETFDKFIEKLLAWMKYEELQNYFMYYTVNTQENIHNAYDINRQLVKR